ncbi:RimK family alpha-L-glutamate ligase [Flavobacterium sp.]|uniref:ATP-grasp domain-containing protein n=1 Tax=Flavobacterium sp. TaxID=239 RepID=UPI0011F58CE6|nr:ATP-grasp domain-containing protein [Flavobacterium sp.]RZJ72381.1 MAG: ATP-grasp domain-containing protein [Flavobacterium sp.]
METILIVNGESYWQDYLPNHNVEQKKIQSTEWLLKKGELYAIDQNGVCKPSKILWRVGAIRPNAKHRTALEIIAMSGIPCVNAAEVLVKGYDRLSMLNVTKACELPLIPFNVATTSTHLKNIQIAFPFVVKAGNYHGGFGKVLVEDERKWQDVKDLLFISEDYVTVEPFIDYEKDIRYLAIGDKIWAMARKGKFWKANVETTDFVLIDINEKLLEQTKKLKDFLKADIVAIDILEDKNGEYHFVEYNDIPGLSGFPDEVKSELAKCIESK